MDIIFSVIREDMFWRTLLFCHFLMAVALLAAVTLQAASVLTSAMLVCSLRCLLVDRRRLSVANQSWPAHRRPLERGAP